MRRSDGILGSTTPRLYTPPLVTGSPGPCGCGCALTPDTSLGFSSVKFAREVIGFEPLPWQRWVLIHGLELLPDGRYRFRTVLILVARQNGKTTIVEIKNLWKMFVQKADVLGTAQDLAVSEESWDNAVEICEGTPELAVEIKDVIKVNGKKTLKLTNGARWRVKATNRRAGRGPSADDVNLDELREHLTWRAWAAVTKTTLARPNAQRWCFTNSGDDTSVVLNAQRAKGRAAAEDPLSDPTMGHFEWSALDEVECTCKRVHPRPHRSDCRLLDASVLATANPALGYTITLEDLRSDANGDPDDVFRTECLCQHVHDLSPAIIDMATWVDWMDEDSLARGKVAFSLDLDPDLQWWAAGFTGRRSDGLLHWQVVAHGEGTNGMVEEAARLNAIHENVGWFIDGSSPAAAKKTDLENAGLTAHTVGSAETAQACINMMDAATNGTGRYAGLTTDLTKAWRAASTIPSGDSKRFGRKKSSGDITPLMVVTLSHHGFRVHGEVRRPPPLFAWSDGDD